MPADSAGARSGAEARGQSALGCMEKTTATNGSQVRAARLWKGAQLARKELRFTWEQGSCATRQGDGG